MNGTVTVVAHARGPGKPLDRLIITHAHPDHLHGSATSTSSVRRTSESPYFVRRQR
ncbi:MBL fold metallo-hydrolase [Streptomyces sp. NPDC020951]|uniref:MBL fold metallo-hydrolase n=1 Tax=Streptomyces sp. NPDC020951 TaxID=3365104 RepID=UPI0037A13FC1